MQKIIDRFGGVLSMGSGLFSLIYLGSLIQLSLTGLRRPIIILPLVIVVVPVSMVFISGQANVSYVVTLSVIKSAFYLALMGSMFVEKNPDGSSEYTNLRQDRALFVVLLLSIVAWYFFGFVNDDLIIFNCILLAISLYRFERPLLAVLNFFLFVVFAVFSEARLALLVALLCVFFLRMNKTVLIIVGATSFFAAADFLKAADFRMVIAYDVLNFLAFGEDLSRILIGHQTIFIDQSSLFFKSIELLSVGSYLGAGKGLITFAALHNQWLHLLVNYGALFTVIVLWMLYSVIKKQTRSANECHYLTGVIFLLGFSHSILFSGSIIAALLFLRSFNARV